MAEKRQPRWRILLIAGTVLLIVLLALRVWLAPDILVPLNTPIRFDDFTFAVVGSREASLLPSESAKRFLLVTLKVHNEAKRVNYQFDRRIAVLIADDGSESGISPEGQRVLDLARGTPDPLAAPLPAGTIGTTELVFDMPPTSKNLRLKISHGGPALDVVDDLVGGRRRLSVK